MMGYDGAWSDGDWLAMGAMMLLVWGLFIGLVVWALRTSLRESRALHASRHQQRTPANRTAPDEVLAELYARGEIDELEFQRGRELLLGSPEPHS